jgi:putative serine protease PepD
MRAPRHLWRGDWRADSERAAEEAEKLAAARRGAPDPEAESQLPQHGTPPALDRNYKKLAIGGVCAGVLGLAFALGALVAGDGGPDPLPAVSKGPVKPGKGSTRASAIYAAASPAVVSVRTTSGSGTGFLIGKDGTVVTNAHVVESNKRVTVRFGAQQSHPADVLGVDPSSDLAVLSIDSGDLPKNVTPLRFADSRNVNVGEVAIAIGNPFGLDRTATEGIVSGIGRHIAAPNGYSIDEVIQTDAPINPGNSGGPLLDESGAVIGVNSQIATGGSQGNIGIGFAVPSNTAREVVPRLAKGEEITRAYLGLETSPASPGGDVGAQVQRAVPDGPGQRAGITVGDVILKLDGKDVNEPADVSAAIAGKRPGDEVEIELERAGQVKKVKATLGKRPARTP